MGIFDFIFGKKKTFVSAKPISNPNSQATINPPTDGQIAYAQQLGVSISKGMTYEQVSQLIKEAKGKQAPYSSDIQLCEQVGLKITPGMRQREVAESMERARNDPTFKLKFEQIAKANREEAEKDEREIYGDDLINDLKRWEAISDRRSYHLLIFRRGKKIVVDVVEVETAEIIDEKKPYVNIYLSLPKRVRDKESGDYLEWDKSIEIKSQSVLHIQQLDSKLVVEAPKIYEHIVAKGKEYACRFEPPQGNSND